MSYKRNKKHSDFIGSADYGYCASRNMNYFGYKLVTLVTLDGIPVVYVLVLANLDERSDAEVVIDYVHGCDILTDKGFIGSEWQSNIFDQTHNRIWTPKRRNQYQQNNPNLDQWLNSIRERIEGVFNEIQNIGRSIECLYAKTIIEFPTRIISKFTSHILRHLLDINYGVNVKIF